MEIHSMRMQGLSIRKIAALKGIGRNTVRRALRSLAPPGGKRQRVKGVKVAPFHGIIAQWLADPIKRHWTAERIFDELEERGYQGGRTVLKEYLQGVRPKPVPTAEARFFVKPGQQVQIDWAEVGSVCVGGAPQKLYVFIAILAWSRQLYVRFTTNMELLTWLDCHRRAFAFFGGVPSEALIDNLKTGVLSRAGATVRWHPAYEQLAVAHGFLPIAHFPMRPKTKGRVERIVRFVRERFADGREVSDLEALNTAAEAWLHERANRRTHRITRERPCDRFAIEREALHPVVEYDLVLEEPRVADAYALVSVEGVRYSVPACHARRALTVQFRPESITFVVGGAIVAQHGYAKAGQRLVQDPAHLPERPKPRHERFAQLGDQLAAQFGDLGQAYVAEVERRAPHAPLAILREVLERAVEFPQPILAAALASLLEFGVVKRGALSTLCYRIGGAPRLPAIPAGEPPAVEVERRSLAQYDETAA
jgi:transposase